MPAGRPKFKIRRSKDLSEPLVRNQIVLAIHARLKHSLKSLKRLNTPFAEDVYGLPIIKGHDWRVSPFAQDIDAAQFALKSGRYFIHPT